jgi:hypothetical protein
VTVLLGLALIVEEKAVVGGQFAKSEPPMVIVTADVLIVLLERDKVPVATLPELSGYTRTVLLRIAKPPFAEVKDVRCG